MQAMLAFSARLAFCVYGMPCVSIRRVKAGLPAFLLHQWVLKGILARYRAFAYKQSDRSVNDQRTIDCFNPSGSAARYQSVPSNVILWRPSGTGRPVRRFYFATENDATGKRFEKTVKIGQVLAPGTVA